MLRNEKGQMAIFVALIFQVLFVFFAMVVNVGLIVHDKIALQNAVDLSAYYGAMKQGEILNNMAHINYQIRQVNKLATVRYRVIGDFGLTSHPVRSGTPNSDTTAYSAIPGTDSANVCVTHADWQESNATDRDATLCNDINFSVSNLPSVNVIAGFLGFVNGIASLVNSLQGAFDRRCEMSGPINWNFAAKIMAMYRMDLNVRKKMFESLGRNLTGSPSDFLDKNGDSVAEGAQKTLFKNMSVQDFSFRNIDFEFMNGLAQGDCGSFEQAFSDIQILPMLFYSDFNDPGGGCQRVVQPISTLPLSAGAYPGLVPMGQPLEVMARGEPADPLMRSSLGYEKNPWCMAYVGVKASMTTRKPFMPFGGTISMEARSFAKPFGGRVGPWHGSTWSRAAVRSSGAPTDAVAPPRANAAGGGATGRMNFARYPGDGFGYRSAAALAAWNQFFVNNIVAKNAVRYADYDHLITPNQYEGAGDSLARGIFRNFELAAIAPDIFDITYYSIEPRYYNNYLRTQLARGTYPSLSPIPDLGAVKPDSPAIARNVEDQLNVVLSGNAQDLGLAFWKVRNIDHVLTSWAQKRAVEYSFPDERFGACFAKPNDARPNPGNCIAGGRNGYSVKHVGKKYLNFNGHELGNDGSSGPIRNSPPDDF